MSPRLRGIWLMLLSASAFGTLAVFARLASTHGANTGTLMFLRFSISSAILIAILSRKKTRLPPRNTLLGLAFMGGVLYVGQSFAYFSALTMIKAGLASLLLYLYPAIVTVLAVAFLKERITRPKALALALA